jgi:16S rRNA processing protein RimM
MPEDWVHLARIRHPQGRKGEIFAELLTDFPEKFAVRKRLWLLSGPSGAIGGASAQKATSPLRLGAVSSVPQASGHDFSRADNVANKARALAPAGKSTPREVELIAHWLHKGGVVLHFAGIDSISAAETLNGLIVAIPRAERAALDEDEIYIGDLIGCALIDVAPAAPVLVGEIEEVDRSAGPVALLVVQGASGEVLVPFAKSYLRSIDIQARHVEMALPEGLVELNAPGKTL